MFLSFILHWSRTLQVLLSMEFLPQKVFCLRIEIHHIAIVVITLLLPKILQHFAEVRYQHWCLC